MADKMQALQMATSDYNLVTRELEKAWREWSEAEVKDLVTYLANEAAGLDFDEMYSEVATTFNRISAGMPTGAKILL